MKQYIISFICFSCLLLSGCNYLDTEPGDAISGDYFWETANAAALEQYCNLYYPKLIKGHGDPLSWNVGAMIMADYQSDNILVSGGSSITYGQNTKLTSNSDWNWSTVRGCNSFLQNYQRSPASEMDKKKYAGEILFFKAFDYYNKVRLFGDVPWYDTALDKDDPDLYKGRDSRIVVMASILKTINQAIEFLPRKTKVYRVSRDAALLLKARICLYEGTWRRYRDMEGDVEYLKEAYNAAGELMDYGYSLYNSQGEDTKGIIKISDVEEVLSIGRYLPYERIDNLDSSEVGHVYGLGVSGFVGSTIEIEAAVFPARKKGAGTIKFNDTAGSMAKDSVFNAASVIRKITEKDIRDYDIHVNVIGGGKIDGPSAGAAITVCIISALTNRPIRQDIAITGEISLRGTVKPVGGIFEKIYGARRKGIKLVAVPKDNEKEVPLGLEDIEVKSINHIEELMEIVFEK